MSPMNPPSTRIRKRRAPQRPLPDPHQTPSGRQRFLLCKMIAKILMLDSVAETKLPDRIKATHCVTSSHPRILLRISKPPRGTTNRPSDFTAGWSDLISACANFESYRCVGAGAFNNTASRLVVIVVFKKHCANTCVIY